MSDRMLLPCPYKKGPWPTRLKVVQCFRLEFYSEDIKAVIELRELIEKGFYASERPNNMYHTISHWSLVERVRI